MWNNNTNKQYIVKKRKHKKTRKIKRESCSPYSFKHNGKKGTCFTKDILLDLKNHYNKLHPSDPITSNHPEQIWKELADKTRKEYNCNKESCWIDKIMDADSHKKQKLKSLLFSPPQPIEWKDNPTEWLSNIDILNVMRQYEDTYPDFYFIGPSSIDYSFKDKVGRCVCPNICNFNLQQQYDKGKRKIGIIFNLDTHDKSGSHWVSLFIDLEWNFVFFFDSTSSRIPKLINIFARKVIQEAKHMNPPILLKFHQNDKVEHQKQNTECGMYSLYFIITLLLREKDGVKLDKNGIMKLFKGRKRIPDKDMEALRNVFFNKPN
jgi:hypothetical protein